MGSPRYPNPVKLLLLLATAVLASAGLYLTAGPVVRWLFGEHMLPTSHLLRLVAAVPVLVAASNLLGVQLLFPLGYQVIVSRFQVLAGLASIVALVPMVLAAGASGSAIFGRTGSTCSACFARACGSSRAA